MLANASEQLLSQFQTDEGFDGAAAAEQAAQDPSVPRCVLEKLAEALTLSEAQAAVNVGLEKVANAEEPSREITRTIEVQFLGRVVLAEVKRDGTVLDLARCCLQAGVRHCVRFTLLGQEAPLSYNDPVSLIPAGSGVLASLTNSWLFNLDPEILVLRNVAGTLYVEIIPESNGWVRTRQQAPSTARVHWCNGSMSPQELQAKVEDLEFEPLDRPIHLRNWTITPSDVVGTEQDTREWNPGTDKEAAESGTTAEMLSARETTRAALGDLVPAVQVWLYNCESSAEPYFQLLEDDICCGGKPMQMQSVVAETDSEASTPRERPDSLLLGLNSPGPALQRPAAGERSGGSGPRAWFAWARMTAWLPRGVGADEARQVGDNRSDEAAVPSAVMKTYSDWMCWGCQCCCSRPRSRVGVDEDEVTQEVEDEWRRRLVVSRG
mmetsp:Transcript_126179/g.288838  ORF Transcript_126179/g.288838 Transcript_126179/m.288838 type:complete len:436 (+) Transcript_126179:39-1346(+)